jgi:hypothetical protein
MDLRGAAIRDSFNSLVPSLLNVPKLWASTMRFRRTVAGWCYLEPVTTGAYGRSGRHSYPKPSLYAKPTSPLRLSMTAYIWECGFQTLLVDNIGFKYGEGFGYVLRSSTKINAYEHVIRVITIPQVLHSIYWWELQPKRLNSKGLVNKFNHSTIEKSLKRFPSSPSSLHLIVSMTIRCKSMQMNIQ